LVLRSSYLHLIAMPIKRKLGFVGAKVIIFTLDSNAHQKKAWFYGRL